MASLSARQNLKVIDRCSDDVHGLVVDMGKIMNALQELLKRDREIIDSLQTNGETIVNQSRSLQSNLRLPRNQYSSAQLDMDIHALRERLRAHMVLVVKWLKQLREEEQQEHTLGQGYRDRLNKIVLPNDIDDKTQETASVERESRSVSRTEVRKQHLLKE